MMTHCLTIKFATFFFFFFPWNEKEAKTHAKHFRLSEIQVFFCSDMSIFKVLSCAENNGMLTYLLFGAKQKFF